MKRSILYNWKFLSIFTLIRNNSNKSPMKIRKHYESINAKELELSNLALYSNQRECADYLKT